jgi:hypothetical protein
MTIRFYIPYARDGLDEIPKSAAGFWPWLVEHQAVAGRGKYTWTLQTYLNLKDAGYPCELVQELPASGVVVSHRDFLPIFLRPRANLFVVCIKADRNPHSWADFQVVQNANDSLRDTADGARRSAAMSFWPQPSLLKRDAARGARCENVAYLGRTLNLAEELRAEAWSAELARQGMNWSVPERPQWNDYRTIDVTVSVRSFDTRTLAHDPVRNVDSKPASKLVNSWLAGVPAILGRESAYTRVRRSPLDFIEIESMADLRAALQSLRSEPARYADMVENGWMRSADFAQEAVTAQWRRLLDGVVAEQHAAWSGKNVAARQAARVWRCLRYLARPEHLRGLLGVLGPRRARADTAA